MVVDARVYFWTRDGMTERSLLVSPNATSYIETAEAVRLLEDAHRRGVEAGKQQLIAEMAWYGRSG